MKRRGHRACFQAKAFANAVIPTHVDTHSKIQTLLEQQLLMSCFDYRWLLRVPARASGLRTRVLFCLLSFDAKTSFTVVFVVKDNLLGLLCRIFTQILGRFALFYEFLIRLRWLHHRSSFLWNLGNIGFPKPFFFNTQNWLELFQQVKPHLYANFVSNSTKVTLGKKRRAPPYLFWSLAQSRASIVRVSHAWRTMVIYSPGEKTGTSHLKACYQSVAYSF